MLVLSRKLNETVVIDGSIEIKIVQLYGGRVRLGITAPESVEIRRSELESRDNAGYERARPRRPQTRKLQPVKT